MWTLTVDDLESIAIGAGILGTGGGGNPYLGKLRLRRLLEQGKQVHVLPLDELPDTAWVTCVGGIGAPTVGIERFNRGDESVHALRTLESYSGKRIDALVSVEIGGGNSIEPMVAAAQTGLPVLDGDGMGRAFPEVQMTSYFMYGIPCTPAVLCDVKHQVAIFDQVTDPRSLERLARAVTIQMGGGAAFAMPVMSGEQVKRTAVPGTLSLTKAIGDAVRAARARNQDPVAAILKVTSGEIIFRGKITDVERWTTKGFARGRLFVGGLDSYAGREMHIEFQNENLIAYTHNENGDEHVTVTVPDLICVVDSDTGEPITTELLRYGFRVTVLGIPCATLLRAPQALQYISPRAFGYEVDYRPMSRTPGVGLP